MEYPFKESLIMYSDPSLSVQLPGGRPLKGFQPLSMCTKLNYNERGVMG